MVCGTGSDAGKSAVVAGLCRLLARQGVRVAPFKAQNMALNSWVTDDGAEIGHAQGVQAVAAGVPAEVAMNPILLKPTGERTSQVVVLGRPWRTLDAAAYHAAKPELFATVLEALDGLRRRFDVVLCEGAGSPTEINLLDHDLVNLRLAARAGMRAVVVGDIDRGGVFASLFGTVALLPDELRPLVAGFVVNKFRGDPGLLAPGLDTLARRTGVPVLGVVPYLEGLGLDAEDSLALDGPDPSVAVGSCGAPGSVADPPGSVADPPGPTIDVAVVRLPRLSNATDLDALALEPDVSVRLSRSPHTLGRPDLLVLPGTKATVDDLGWLRRSGMAAAIERLVADRSGGGPMVLGICGGYQMLGRRIVDGVESGEAEVAGLGLLPVDTVFRRHKLTRWRRGTVDGVEVAGYDIRHGRLHPQAGTSPWIRLDDRWGTGGDGMADRRRGVYGTSLHGLLQGDSFRGALLSEVAARHSAVRHPSAVSFAAARMWRIDRLADALAEHLDTDRLAALVAAGATTSAPPVR